MAVSIQTARTLCTKAELDLVLASTKTKIGTLSATQLRTKRERARKLRDKFRDLSHRQRREIRGKDAGSTARPAQDNRATLKKEQLFSETLERFEQALAAAEASGSTAPAADASKKEPVGRKLRRKNTRARANAAAIETSKKVGAAKKKRKATAATRAKATPQAADSGNAAPQTPAQKTARSPKTAKNLKALAGSKASKATIVGGKVAARSTVAAQTTTPPAAPRKKSAKKKSSALAAASTNSSRQDHAESAVPKAKKRAILKGGTRRLQAHIASKGRRNQAKRDSR